VEHLLIYLITLEISPMARVTIKQLEGRINTLEAQIAELYKRLDAQSRPVRCPPARCHDSITQLLRKAAKKHNAITRYQDGVIEYHTPEGWVPAKSDYFVETKPHA
jgi:hypothetical protein